MLKTLTRNDTTTTPYVATKDWNLSNVANEDLVLSEAGNPVAAENIDYFQTTNQTNYNCSVAKEDQSLDLVRYREGLKTLGLFYPDLDPKNIDGTYKRMVYTQIKTMFYNNFRDPTKMWGTEKIDFDTSQTKKFLSDSIKLFDIPTDIMGQKIVEGSVSIIDNTLDNDYLITDDKNCNLFAGTNLFSKQQELGEHSNIFLTGSDATCRNYFLFDSPSAPVLTGALISNSASSLSASLSWSITTSVPQDGFVLQRSSSLSSGFLDYQIFSSNTFVFVDSPLVSFNEYLYRIRAFNAFGDSAYSNIVDILVIPFDSISVLSGSTTGSFANSSNYTNSLVWFRTASFSPTLSLLRSSGSSNFSTFANVTGLTQTIDTTVVLGQIYYYKLLTTSSFSQSFSNTVTLSLQGAFESWNEYTTGQSQSFASGSGNWVGAWFDDITIRLISSESWNEYVVNQMSGFGGGFGWMQDSIWDMSAITWMLTASESFDEYVPGQSTNFTGGLGWSGSSLWSIA